MVRQEVVANTWVTATDGLAFVRVVTPSTGEQAWADALAPAINSAIDTYLGNDQWASDGAEEISALALRAFGFGWRYREAPFGEAQYLDQAGGVVRLPGDWIAPIKPALQRYRDMGQLIG